VAQRAEYGGDLLTVVCHDGVEFGDPGIWRLAASLRLFRKSG
jgi:hypothetical protein